MDDSRKTHIIIITDLNNARMNDDEISNEIKADIRLAKCSEFVSKQLKENPDKPIVIDMQKDIVRLIIEWVEHFDFNAKQFEENDEEKAMDITLDEYNETFFKKLDTVSFFRFVIAAHDLQIPGLMNIVSKRFAQIFRGKTPEEMRDIIGVDRRV